MARMRLLSSLVGLSWALVACTVKVVDVSNETGESEAGTANMGEVDEPCDPDTGMGEAEGAPGTSDDDDDGDDASPCAGGFECRPVVDDPGMFVCQPEKEPPKP